MLFANLLFFCNFSNLVFAQSSETQVTDESTNYTLMPMFISSSSLGLAYEDLLSTMVKDQGYEAHCGGAQWVIDKKIWGDIDKFFSSSVPPEESFYQGLNPTIFGGANDYVVDFSKARIPLFRGLEPKTETLKNSSFEGMFGADFQTVGDQYMLNASGISQRLLSSYQQCLAKTQNLAAITKICAQVANDKCILDKEFDFPIAVDAAGNSRAISESETLSAEEHRLNVAFNSQTLLDWLKNLRPQTSEEELYPQVCSDLFSGGDEENQNQPALSASIDEIAKAREAIRAVSIDLDSLYRLAFLVLVPKQNKNESNDNFHFLQSSPQVNDDVHAPIIIAFKIPEFGTNKSKLAGNIDTLEIVKMALQSSEQNQLDIENQDKKRIAVYESAKEAPYSSDSLIKCPASYPQCSRSDQNALNNVLIDVINGTAPNCQNTTLRIVEEESDSNAGSTVSATASANIEDIFNQEDVNFEKAGDLFTPASKDIKDYNYKNQNNQKIADQLLSQDVNAFNWQLVIDSNPPKLDEQVIVNAYLVLPVGEAIKDANKALSIFWNEEEFFNTVRTNVIEDMDNKAGVIPKYYTIKNAEVGIDGSDSISPLDECRYEEVIKYDSKGVPYVENVRVCKNYTVGVNLEEPENNVLLPDFGLGFLIRKIQQKLRNSYNQTYNYIASCTRVEDMFLGRCSGRPQGSSTLAACTGEAFKNIKNIPSATQIPQFAKDYFVADIAPGMTAEVMEAYEYAEKETGIPCEIVAGIHWNEAGSSPTRSVFDGGEIRNGSLKEDAKAAMQHLIDKFGGNFDRNNIEYEALVTAIGAYNGTGNQNCDKDTRWANNGKCPSKFSSEDHPYPMAWIDERHTDMDLIFCVDYVEFNCEVNPTDAVISELRSSLDEKQVDDATKEELIDQAKQYCFANSSNCQSLSNGNKYPAWQRPGALATAILLNEAGL